MKSLVYQALPLVPRYSKNKKTKLLSSQRDAQQRAPGRGGWDRVGKETQGDACVVGEPRAAMATSGRSAAPRPGQAAHEEQLERSPWVVRGGEPAAEGHGEAGLHADSALGTC